MWPSEQDGSSSSRTSMCAATTSLVFHWDFCLDITSSWALRYTERKLERDMGRREHAGDMHGFISSPPLMHVSLYEEMNG